MDLTYWVEDTSIEAAGLYTAVLPLILELKNQSHNVDLFASKVAENNSHWQGTNITEINIKAPFTSLKDCRINHCHGLWSKHSIYSSLLSTRKDFPLIISPHGMLDEWAMNQSKYKKRFAKLLYENRAFKNAHCVHALTSNEADSIRKHFGTNIPIEIIPNGVYIPSFKNNKELGGIINIVFLARLHEKKGINELLTAWSHFAKTAKKHNVYLTIAGYGDNNLMNKLKGVSLVNFRYVGPVFGKEKETLLQQAHFTILPSFSEGLPMSVLESWSYGVPSLMSSNCNLNVGFDKYAALECEPNNIIEALQRVIMTSNEDYKELRNNAVVLASNNFSWKSIAQRHIEVYSKVYDEFGRL